MQTNSSKTLELAPWQESSLGFISTDLRDYEVRRQSAQSNTHSEPESADWASLRTVLLRTALRATRDETEAEDIVHTALLRALERRSTLPPDVNWQAWLMTVMRRLIIDRARMSQTLKSSGHDPDAVIATTIEPPPTWACVTPHQLDTALSRCKPSLQEVFELCCHQNLKHAEVAARLRISLRTVATRLYRARGALRTLLEPLIQSEST